MLNEDWAHKYFTTQGRVRATRTHKDGLPSEKEGAENGQSTAQSEMWMVFRLLLGNPMAHFQLFREIGTERGSRRTDLFKKYGLVRETKFEAVNPASNTGCRIWTVTEAARRFARVYEVEPLPPPDLSDEIVYKPLDNTNGQPSQTPDA